LALSKGEEPDVEIEREPPEPGGCRDAMKSRRMRICASMCCVAYWKRKVSAFGEEARSEEGEGRTRLLSSVSSTRGESRKAWGREERKESASKGSLSSS
jgi:hypothetical protein